MRDGKKVEMSRMKEKKMRVVIEKEISTINTGFYTIVWLSEQLAFKLSSRSRFDDGMES